MRRGGSAAGGLCPAADGRRTRRRSAMRLCAAIRSISIAPRRVLVGPGLGRDADARDRLALATGIRRAVVADAMRFGLFSGAGCWSAPAIMTPHEEFSACSARCPATRSSAPRRCNEDRKRRRAQGSRHGDRCAGWPLRRRASRPRPGSRRPAPAMSSPDFVPRAAATGVIRSAPPAKPSGCMARRRRRAGSAFVAGRSCAQHPAALASAL